MTKKLFNKNANNYSQVWFPGTSLPNLSNINPAISEIQLGMDAGLHMPIVLNGPYPGELKHGDLFILNDFMIYKIIIFAKQFGAC